MFGKMGETLDALRIPPIASFHGKRSTGFHQTRIRNEECFETVCEDYFTGSAFEEIGGLDLNAEFIMNFYIDS
jgi:hypothetical protein